MGPIPPLPTSEEALQAASGLMGLPAVVTACLCAFLIVAVCDWRLLLLALTGLYGALALLIATVQPAQWALLRLIVGGLVAIVWYLAAQEAGWGGRFLPFQSRPGVHARPLSSTTLFRTALALFLAGTLLSTRLRVPLPSVPPDIRLVATWLAAFALLGLGIGDEALQNGSALLLWLAATQLVIGALRQDAWLIWLMSCCELLVGLATGYLMVARGPAQPVSQDEGAG